MRLATMSDGERNIVAIERVDQFYNWSDVIPGDPPASILEAIASGKIFTEQPVFEGARPLGSEYKLLAPFPRPQRNVICLGKNYAAHAEEFAAGMGENERLPSAPIVFTKATTSVTAPGATIIVASQVTTSVDYEVELAVVIGRQGRFIPHDQAFEYVAGYTIINDLSARDLQKRHKQWFLGKSVDGFCPMGPIFVTRDEIKDLKNTRLSMRVDGELRQHATVQDLIFDIPTIIETLSSVFTLQVGDIIATGTPQGVGLGFNPPRYLQHGSVMEAQIDYIGTLRNRIEFSGMEERSS